MASQTDHGDSSWVCSILSSINFMCSLIAFLCSYCVVITEGNPAACSVSFKHNVLGVTTSAAQPQDTRSSCLQASSQGGQHLTHSCWPPIAPPAPQPTTTITGQQGCKNQASWLLFWSSHNQPKVTLCIYTWLKNLHTFKLLSTIYVVTPNIHWPLAECILIEVIIHSAPAARIPSWYVWKQMAFQIGCSEGWKISADWYAAGKRIFPGLSVFHDVSHEFINRFLTLLSMSSY